MAGRLIKAVVLVTVISLAVIAGLLVVTVGEVALPPISFDPVERIFSSSSETEAPWSDSGEPAGVSIEEMEGPAADVETTLLIGTSRPAPGRPSKAAWMTLLAVNNAARGAVLYIPAHTAAEIPGHGLLAAGSALGSGGAPLLVVTMENLLGIDIDSYVVLRQESTLALLEATGPLTVNVPTDVRSPPDESTSRTLFHAGLQRLTPAWQARLIYAGGPAADEVTLGPLVLAEWDALLERYRADPGALGRAVRSAPEAFGGSDTSAEAQGRFLEALAEVPLEGLTLASIPVSDLGLGHGGFYSPQRAELDALLERALGIEGVRQGVTRVQVLNGNGVPGIGEEIAKALLDGGFSVVLWGNAARLDYRRTLIVSHGDSPGAQRSADRARELLGVGEVRVSSAEQGIVDLTIVVGRDFPRER